MVKTVQESIDERILRVLGLEEVFDLDYETYKQLLLEKMVAARMSGSELAAEEDELLRDEYKRVRNKEEVRFKIKKKKVKVENVTNLKKPIALLPGKGGAIVPMQSSLANIVEAVDGITKGIEDQNKLEKKDDERDRKKKEDDRREKRENKLETNTKKLIQKTRQLFTPTKGILDKIFNFLFYTFLASGINKAFKWFGDPENAGKVDAIKKFLSDFWPALSGAALILLTPIGGLIKALASTLFSLGGALLSNPIIAAAAGIGIASAMLVGRSKTATEQQLKERGLEEATPQEQAKELSKPGSILETLTRMLLPSLNAPAKSGGGMVSPDTGRRIRGAGPDTQLTALMPGEVVMNKAAVSAIGANNLLAANKKFGGANANMDKFDGGIQFAQGGGMVGGFMNWFNKGANTRIPVESKAKFGNPFSYFQKNPDPTTLFGDDALQRGQSDANFAKGKRPSVFGRPDRALLSRDLLDWHSKPSPRNPMGVPRPRYVPGTKGGPASAPTPITRELVKRPIRAARSFGQASFGNPLLMLAEMIINDLISPQPTAVYDQVTGPNAYYNDPMYKGPMPTPLERGSRTEIIRLPSVDASAGSVQPTQSPSTSVPEFSAVAPGNRRGETSQIYGLVN